MKRHLLILLTRWTVNSLILMILILWPRSGIYLASGWLTLLVAGLVLTLVNIVLKPLIILSALPFLFLTLGVFNFIVSTLVIWLTAHFYNGLTVDGWFWTVLTGLLIGLCNYGITIIFTSDNFLNKSENIYF